VNINDLSRIQLLAFFLNAYNLMVLHAHVVRGSTVCILSVCARTSGARLHGL
jgi:hypothetical protein